MDFMWGSMFGALVMLMVLAWIGRRKQRSGAKSINSTQEIKENVVAVLYDSEGKKHAYSN